MVRSNRSAGLLMYRRRGAQLEVYLVHPGGPYWAGKDLAAWSLPKGEYHPEEDALLAARREMQEETGVVAEGPYLPLGEVTQSNGKHVLAWAFEGDADPARLVSNTCHIEWPPRSGKSLEIPEVDRAAWFTIAEAEEVMFKSQRPFLQRLVDALSRPQ